MAFFAEEISTQPVELSPKQPKFAITQLKFPLKSPSTFTIKRKQPPPTIRDSLCSQQLRRFNSYRADRQKKQERLSSGLQVGLPGQNEEDAKARMFMTWRERAHSSKKIYVPMNKIIQEVIKTKLTDLPQRTASQKKFAEQKHDLEFRRNKVQTPNRIVSRSPIELLTRKLEWQGKERKKLVSFEPRFFKQTKAASEQRLRGGVLMPLCGWEGQLEEEWLFADKMG